MAEVTVAEVMRADIPLLSPTDPVREAVTRLMTGPSSVAPVLDVGGRLVGILTERDCFRPALDASYYQQWNDRVGDVMTRDVATLDAGLDIVVAAQRFLDLPYRAFPVTDGKTVVGLLDRHDVLRALVERG